MIIKVTQKHIDNGVEALCGSCPVALAIFEALGVPVFVTTEKVYHRGFGSIFGKEIGILPYEASEKIRLFDYGYGMRPFSFELM